jgi:branched-chain amino acid transport system substrate-binding protein
MKRLFLILTMLLVLGLIAAQCATAQPETVTVVETVVVEKEVEKVVEKEVIVTKEVEKIVEVEVPAEEEAPTGPIKIGASLPLTGDFAVNGQKHADGYQLCVDLINEAGGLLGRQVELIVSDNQSDVDTAIAQTERFISVDQVDLMFGTYSSRLTFPVTAITEQARMIYPIPSGAALRIYERGFRFIFYFQTNPAEYFGTTTIEMIQNLVPEEEQPKTAALIYADDFFANAIAAGLKGDTVELAGTNLLINLAPGALAEAEIEPVYVEQWPEGFSDWITLANSVKASNADFLIGLTASPDETIQLVRAMQTVGYQPKGVYLSQGTQEEFKEGVGDAANGITIHASWHPAVEWEGRLAGKPYTNLDFSEDFTERFGRAPDEDESIPFALCQGMEQGVRGAGTTDNIAVRDWLAARTAEEPVKTILGDFHWDQRGLPVDKANLMTQWQDGELKFVYPVDEFPGTAELIWPKPEW